MNISVSRLTENDGSGLDDRPSYVEEALTPEKRVGYRDGLPLVDPPDDVDTDVRLGDDLTPLYAHYPTPDELMLPAAESVIRRLFDSEHVTSLSDASSELNTDRRTLERAAELHGIEEPEPTEGGDDAEDSEGIVLPSGEAVPFEWSHSLVLAQLLSDGMSVSEAARYLSRETGERITESDVREAATEAGLLDGTRGTDSTPLHAPASRTQTAGDREYSKTPW